jgi:hypothetical protein
MHTTSLFVASVAVLSTLAFAEPDRPKFYFPRSIKRPIFQNSTLTTHTSKGTDDSSQDVFSSTTKRQSFTEFLNGITGTNSDTSGLGSAAGTGNLLDSLFPTSGPTSSSSAAMSTTTVVIQQTTVVGIDPTPTPTTTSTSDPLIGSTGLLPLVIIAPTSPTTDTSALVPTTSSAAASTDGGITFGPDGVLTTSSSTPDPAAPQIRVLHLGCHFRELEDQQRHLAQRHLRQVVLLVSA